MSAPVQALGGLVWLGNAALAMTDTGGSLVLGLDGRVTTLARPNAAGEHNLYPQASLPDGRTVLAVAARGSTTFGPVVAVVDETWPNPPPKCKVRLLHSSQCDEIDALFMIEYL